MALSRKLLKGMGLTEEQMDSIIDAHTETLEGLKSENDDLKEKLKGVTALTEERDRLKNELDQIKADGGEDLQAKLDALQKEYDGFKAQVEGEKTAEKIRAAYKKLLDDEHIDPKLHDLILKGTDISGMKLDSEGKLENAEALKKTIGESYAGFRLKTDDKGVDVGGGDGNGGGNGGNGANPLAAQIAQKFHERRYGADNSGNGSGGSDGK